MTARAEQDWSTYFLPAEGPNFRPAGFRAYSLTAPDGTWRIVLSRIEVNAAEPKGQVTVYAPKSPAAFRDLDGYLLARNVWLYGRNLEALAGTIAARAGASGSRDEWLRRLDYLIARAVREAQGSTVTEVAISGAVERPAASPYVFAGRVRAGRTCSLFGPGSAGKTTISSGLIVSMDTGREIVPGWVPTRPFVVGVLDWDEGEEEERVRLYAITNAAGVELTAYHYKRMARPLAEAADEVGRWVTDNGIEVLFVTPVNRAARPASGDPSGPIHELYEVLREFGTTNFLVDHVTGSNIDNKDTAREYGSVAKRDNVRGSYSFFAQYEEPGRRVVVMRNTKPDALTPRRAPEAVRIEFDPPWPDDNGGYERISFHADVVIEGGRAGETRWQKLVRILEQYGPTQTKTQVSVLTGFDVKELRDIARDARDHGHEVVAEGDSWTLKETTA